MKILLTNDDGIRALGIWAMAAVLIEKQHDVIIVAPMKQQSRLVFGQASAIPRPVNSFAASTAALCSPPQAPQGTLSRKRRSSASIIRLDRPHAQLTAAPDAARANSERSCITFFPHEGQR